MANAADGGAVRDDDDVVLGIRSGETTIMRFDHYVGDGVWVDRLIAAEVCRTCRRIRIARDLMTANAAASFLPPTAEERTCPCQRPRLSV